MIEFNWIIYLKQISMTNLYYSDDDLGHKVKRKPDIVINSIRLILDKTKDDEKMFISKLLIRQNN